jgi:hypothetical protein
MVTTLSGCVPLICKSRQNDSKCKRSASVAIFDLDQILLISRPVASKNPVRVGASDATNNLKSFSP